MIVRIVKMEFKEECVEEFIELFESRKEQIRNFKGCQYLELLQGTEAKSKVFMTYSYWKSEKELNDYRYSSLFEETWTLTKKMFSRKPEAISFKKLHSLD